jgi:hypothetical protein
VKKGISLLGLLFCALESVPIVSGQGTHSSPLPPLQVLGPQLIAWSQLQQPQPVPQSSPDGIFRRREAQSAGQGTIQNLQTIAPIDQPRPAAGNFTGFIAVIEGQCLLRLANNSTLQLDDQEKARQYEGRQVKIAGTLDESGGKLYVMSIELDS